MATYVPYKSGVASTEKSIVSGAIANIGDGNLHTNVRLTGTNHTPNIWFQLDLGASVPVYKVVMEDFEEVASGDTGFYFVYSDSPLVNGGNGGAAYAATFIAPRNTVSWACSMVQYQADYSAIVARYWGLRRDGNFVGTSIILSNFSLFYRSNGGLMVPRRSRRLGNIVPYQSLE